MSYFARSWNYNVNVEEFKTTYYSIFVITIRHQMKKTEGEENFVGVQNKHFSSKSSDGGSTLVYVLHPYQDEENIFQ